MQVVTQPLAAGAQRIQSPQTTGDWLRLKVANESPYDLVIQIAGSTHELGPQVADLYELNGANFIDVIATALQPVAGAPTTQLELTWAAADEPIPGTYPVALMRETSGQTAITNAQLAVVNALNTKLTSARPPQLLAQIFQLAGTNGTTNVGPLPPDTQALAVILSNPLNDYGQLTISWHTPAFMSWTLLDLNPQQAVYVVPILPSVHDNSATLLNTLDVLVHALGGTAVVELVALFESAPLWLELFPTPQANPNALSPIGGSDTIANASAVFIKNPGGKLYLFDITQTYVKGASTDFFILGYGSVLPLVIPSPASWLAKVSSAAPFTYPFRGVPLPAGSGIWVWNNTGGSLAAWFAINASSA